MFDNLAENYGRNCFITSIPAQILSVHKGRESSFVAHESRRAHPPLLARSSLPGTNHGSGTDVMI
jgi:hypothetical protein